MRRLGQNICPRDEEGWRVPHKGTASRQVYDLLVLGLSVDQIAARLKRSVSWARVHKRAIVAPDLKNAYALKYLRKEYGE